MCDSLGKRPGRELVVLVAAAVAVALAAGAFNGALAGPSAAGPARAGAPEKLPAMSEFVEGMTATDGFYTLYRPAEQPNKLYAKIRRDQIGQEFLVATSIARGRVFYGWQWGESIMVWRRNDRQLMLVVPDVWHRADDKSPIAAAVEDTYTEVVVRSLPILADDGKGNVIVDLGTLYLKSPQSMFGHILKNADASLARLNSVKAFPNNLEVAADLYPRDTDSGYAMLMTVHYSLSAIPQSSYKPRHADDRIGYFLSAVADYSRSPREESQFVRYINRWHLEKADPSLDLSPPKEPIVFYLDKNIPVRYRRYVREGVLEWNRAFEKVGIADAIVARQQTHTNEFADFDPADARYNFIRWITTDRAYAMGPSRANPRTGEILDADIVFDDAMLRWVMTEYDLMIEDGMVATLSPELRRFLDEHPERHPGRVLRDRRQARTPLESSGPIGLRGPVSMADPLAPFGELGESAVLARGACSIGRGKSHQLAIAGLLLAEIAESAADPATDGDSESGAAEGDSEDGDAADDDGASDETAESDEKDEWPEELIGQFIKETVMHEVGHTLGLRHNFKGSAWRELAELHNPTENAGQLSGSVMDYNPINIAAAGKLDAPYQMTTIGPYDYWAIEYGYTPVKAATPEAERPELDKIAARVAEPSLAYGTDIDAWSVDPLTNRWDMGSDPIDFATDRFALFQKLKGDLVARAIKPGASYGRLRNALDAVFWDYQYASALAARYVGASYVHRDHRGDPGERNPIEPVPVEKQRQALTLLAENVFADDGFDFPPDLVNKLSAGRWEHWGSPDYSLDPSYPLHDRVLTLQLWTMFQLMNPVRMRYVYDGELRVDSSADAITLPEVFSALTDAIFAEVKVGAPVSARYTNRKPFVSSIRRNLQREYVAELTAIALDADSAYPRAAQTLAWDHLRQLSEDIEAMTISSRMDDYSAAHLRETGERLKRAISATYQLEG